MVVIKLVGSMSITAGSVETLLRTNLELQKKYLEKTLKIKRVPTAKMFGFVNPCIPNF